MNDQPYSDSALKELRVVTPAPPEEVMAARRMLNAAIEREKAGAPARRWSPRPWLAAAATGAAALVAVFAVSVALSVLQAPGVEASLDELSDVALVQPELFAEPGIFLYSVGEGEVVAGDALPLGDADEVYWIQPIRREVWERDDGSVFLRETFGEPIFFDPATEAAFDAAGYRDLHAEFGATVETTGSDGNTLEPGDFPTEPTALAAAMRVAAGEANLGPDAFGMADVAASLLVEADASPAFRSAVLAVLADTDGIELVERADDLVEVAASSPTETISLAFDPDTGGLLEVTRTLDVPPAGSRIPAGTATTFRYEPPTLTDQGPFAE